MFERFRPSAREAVIAATQFATGARAPELREEHLALAVLAGSDTPGLRALAAAGCAPEEREALVGDLADLSHRAGVTSSDVDALHELGIDVDDVLTRLTEVARESSRPRRVLGKRRDKAVPVRWSFGAKRVLERALREAIDLQDRGIDDGHVLLALLGVRGGVAEVMQERGITYAALRRAVALREAG